MLVKILSRFLPLVFGLSLAVYTSDTTVILECGECEPVCKGARVKMLCLTETSIGALRWVEYDTKKELAYFDSDTNSSVTTKNITFTLQGRDETLSGKHIYHSSAVINNITNDMKIGCSAANDVKYCEIRVINVSRPTWTNSPCQFTRERVFLSWNPPSVGERCCKNYVVKEGEPAYFINTTINATRLSRKLNNRNYTVQCVERADVLGPASVPLYINPDAFIKFVFIKPDVVDAYAQKVKYNITWKAKRSKMLSDRIICTPEVTMVKFSCLSPGSTVCQIPKPVESRTAYCTVRQNESIMAEVTITNRAGRNNTKADTADILAKAYKALEKVSRRDKPRQNSTCNRGEPQCTGSMVHFVLLFVTAVIIMLG